MKMQKLTLISRIGDSQKKYQQKNIQVHSQFLINTLINQNPQKNVKSVINPEIDKKNFQKKKNLRKNIQDRDPDPKIESCPKTREIRIIDMILVPAAITKSQMTNT